MNPPPIERPVISIIGVLHPGGRVEVSSVARTAVLSAELRGVASDLRVTLLGAKGAELASAPLVALPSHGCCACQGGPDRSQPLVQAWM